jgi:UrcA family protein
MIKIAFACTALALVAAPGLAKDGSWQVGRDQIHLVYSDIPTSTAAGRATLLTRVERAAEKLCETRRVRVEQLACVQSILDDAAAHPRNHALLLAMNERDQALASDR